jgi:hypothetical protein
MQLHLVNSGQRHSAMLRARLVEVKEEKVEQQQYVSEAIECEVCRRLHTVMPSVAGSC